MMAVFATVLMFGRGWTSQDLVGQWLCQSPGGSITLMIEPGGRLVFNGEPAAYVLAPGVIRIEGEEGMIDYPYSLQTNALVVTFPGGDQLRFERVSHPSGIGSFPSGGQGQAIQATENAFSGLHAASQSAAVAAGESAPGMCQ